jgi:hypothetical protein
MLQKVVLVVVALALAAIVPVAAQNPRFDNLEIRLMWTTTVTPPDLRCEGGEPTGLPFPQCSEGTKHIVGRNEVQTWWPMPVPFEGSVPDELNGPIIFVVNCNFSADYRGPCRGTFRWELSEDVYWEGTWTAPVMDLVTYEARMSMVGHGVGGEIDGMQIKFDGASEPPDNWFIIGSVRIH